jgi:hypothetical protein
MFDAAVKDGYPGISLWWPATFPAKLESPVWSVPGLGTPDIFGRLGVGIYYSLDGKPNRIQKTRFETLKKSIDGDYIGEISGPEKATLSGIKSSKLQFKFRLLDQHSGELFIGSDRYSLVSGSWSSIITLSFRVGFGISIKAITRGLLTVSKSGPSLYLLPLQIHPLRSAWPYGTPKKLLRRLWNDIGSYLTLGWPQDTTGLEEKLITDQQFLRLCDDICLYRERVLMNILEGFNEGVLACVFDSLDRIQHMYLRDRQDIIESWYVKLDALFGRIIRKIQQNPKLADTRVLVVSDHGFGEFEYKVHLNRWLMNHGYLHSTNSQQKGNLSHVDWHKTQYYAIGLNSLYLNLVGREANGQVHSVDSKQLLEQISNELTRWKGPDGRNVIASITPGEMAFQGPYAKYGPDLVVGYSQGYRASSQTGLGDWEKNEIESNQDHWGADHCFAPEFVPGVIFSNQGLQNHPNPTYADIPELVLGKAMQQKDIDVEPHFSDEDQEQVNQRLRELGYL